MSIKRIDHIAIVVPDIEGALAFYEDALGMRVERVEQVDDQEVLVAFLPAGESELELVEPLNDTSGVAKYLSRRGPGIHHLCMEVDDLDATLRKLKARKVRLINETPTIGSGGKRIAFIHPESTFGVLVELYESSPEEPQRQLRTMPLNTLRSRVSVETRAVSAAFSAFVKALRGKKGTTPPALPAKNSGIRIKSEGEMPEQPQ
jgi:methylmalonyl-CoA/ethylmalonyl-CoA epimerase